MRLKVRASLTPEQLVKETYELAKNVPLPNGMYTETTEAVRNLTRKCLRTIFEIFEKEFALVL
jgi:hypothetical protein